MKKNKIEDQFNLDEFIKKSKSDKKKYIAAESLKIKSIPKNIIKELKPAYRNKEVLNKFIVDYIKKIKSETISQDNKAIQEQIDFFKKNYIEKKLPEKINEKIENLYSMSEAMDFCRIQLVLRSLSTSVGNLWEKIAMCSDCSINPENEFGIKITGVDIITLINEKPYYIQIKTMEDTLTGSQRPRSEKELLLHTNSYFAAALDTGRRWTFNSNFIEKLKGNEFWSLINLDYDYIIKEVGSMIKEIENEYYKLTVSKN